MGGQETQESLWATQRWWDVNSSSKGKRIPSLLSALLKTSFLVETTMNRVHVLLSLHLYFLLDICRFNSSASLVASLVAQMVKNLPAMRETWVGKITWRRTWQPTPVFLPGESPWTEEPDGHSLWVCKELDMTERLSTHAHKVVGLESCEVASLVLLCWSLGDKCNF